MTTMTTMTTSPPDQHHTSAAVFEPGIATAITLAGGDTWQIPDDFRLYACPGEELGWRGVEQLLTPAQVGDLFHVGPRFAGDMRRKGLLTGVRVGHGWLYTPDDVRALIAQLREEATR